MSNIPAILVGNGSAVMLLCILLLSSRRTLHYGMLDHKLFVVMILSDMLQSLAETASFLLDGRPGPVCHGLGVAVNTLLYLNNIGFAFTWTVFADYKLFGDVGRIRRRYGYVAIPAMMIALGCVINLFTPVFFVITAENVYQRAALYPLAYAVTYLYLAYGVLMIYHYRRKVNRYLFLPAILFMIPILVGSLLQYLFYGVSLIWVGAAIGLTSLYINVQNEVSFLDSMSGSFTRQYLIQYLHQQLSGRGAEKNAMSGIMLDIDHFKRINDTYGHLIGDDAIARTGELLRSAVGERDLVTRYGGDEFVVLHPTGGSCELPAIISRIKAAAEALNQSGKTPYTIHFSFGCGEYREGDSVDSFLNRLDAAMYEEKRQKADHAAEQMNRL